MISNYILLALRNIKRNYTYALLNVLGLTLGVAACLTIFLIVRNELNYDNFDKADRTCRVTLNALDFNSCVSMAVAPAMRTDFPELEQVSQVLYRWDGVVRVNNKRFSETPYAYVDSHFTHIFNYHWIEGNANTALSEPNSIVLTISIAKKYFGSTDAIGQVINLNKDINLKVTGVIEDVPSNTSLPFGFLVSIETINKDLKNFKANFWAIGGGFFTYILLPPHYSVERIQSKMPVFLKKNWNKEVGKDVRIPLQPLRDIHFDQRYINNVVTPTSKNIYYALLGVALLIIITACINFINLSTAQAIKRAREVGVRKILGAKRLQLIGQFMGETAVLVSVAVVLGVAVSWLFLSKAEKLLYIDIQARQLTEPIVLGWIAGLTMIVIVLAGLYPAFVQSAFQPVDALKSRKSDIGKGFTLRKGLVVIQFVITQILIVGTLVIAHQMDYFENQDLGFKKDAVVSFYLPDIKKLNVLKEELTSIPGIKQISFSSGAPSYNASYGPFSAPNLGLIKEDVTEVKYVDENYTHMFGLKMLAGTQVTKSGVADTIHNIVANETMIHKLGIINPQDAIGRQIRMNERVTNIIGVVQDFQSESKHKQRRACALEYRPNGFFAVSVKLQAAGMPTTINRISKSWSALFPDDLFQYEFLDDHIASLYTQEQKEYTAFKLFSAVAIIVGCLGLYGLIALAAAQRTKEVGIRKVLGASLLNIITLFSREFVLLILVAFIIAAPLAYYLMYNWLQNYAYHIHINATIFLITVVISFFIAAITIAWQTIKAALTNPVKSLRNE